MLFYEMKKIFSRTGGRIAGLLLLLTLSVTCYFAIIGVRYVDETGKTTTGRLAIQKLREAKKAWEGPLTEEKIRQVIEENARIMRTEEARSKDAVKNDIAYGWRQGFSDIRQLLVYSYCSFREYDYYRPDSLRAADAPSFYENRTKHLKEWLDSEEGDVFSDQEKAFLIRKYDAVKTPFWYAYADGWRQLLEFVPTIQMLTVLILAFLTADIFSEEFRLKTDAVFYTAYHGRGKAAQTKLAAGFLLVTGVYWGMFLLYSGIVLAFLGADGANCPIQCGPGWKSFYNITYLQEYLLTAAGGYVGSLFLSLLVMLVSAVTRSNVVAVTIPFAVIFLPSFLGDIRAEGMGKVLTLLPDQLLQLNRTVNLFSLYDTGAKITGAVPVLFFLYTILALAEVPFLLRSCKRAQVR